ncbi:MAG: ligase-associated DNA damage response DEXH box helicase [Phycisphaeraceae bacterium]
MPPDAPHSPAPTTNPILAWFERTHAAAPFDFQRATWDACLAGESGLVHAPTGMGKTHAAWLPPLMRWCAEHGEPSNWPTDPPPLKVLWITPLRALAADTTQTLQQPIDALGLPWTVQRRTGDVSSSIKAKQRKRLPTALVTTPESLSLLLSYSDAKRHFAHLECIVVDEWHELMASKRGTQTELALARLRAWNPKLQTWGLSATMGNLDEALDVLMGTPQRAARARLICGEAPKTIAIDTVMPEDIARFPWAGHLGLSLLPQVIDVLEDAKSALLFTNTRSQAELWFAALMREKPDWLGQIALHHGSLDQRIRQRVEDMLREGTLRCVVCTSSLDLGVDFSPVDRVIQVGSPKGVARLMQRAGRSGHQPGAVSRVIGVPTHALELIEFTAARQAVAQRAIEARAPRRCPLDVLVQHLVTVAMGGGFDEETMRKEVCTTWAFRELTERQWRWAMDFVTRGGEALTAYPEYARVVHEAGRYSVPSRQVAQRHRMAIGTITSDAALAVKYRSGRTLGTVEESFIARLKPGQTFVFAGKVLELLQVRGMAAYVQRARRKSGTVPRWQGSKSPLSSELADHVRLRLEDAREGRFDDAEMRSLRPLMELQQRWSRIPAPDELLIERLRTHDGFHLFGYPLQGRLVHEGLGALLAYRFSAAAPRSISVTVNDYGFDLLSGKPIDLDESAWRKLLRTDRLVEDLLACLNATELARRQFREIARVAGLIFTGYPGQSKSARQLQASSEMFYDVLSEYDPDNLLLDQAQREVLEQQLEVRRLRTALDRLDAMTLRLVDPPRLTPMGFPLWAEQLRENYVTSEKWSDRVRKMAVSLESAASEGR